MSLQDGLADSKLADLWTRNMGDRATFDREYCSQPIALATHIGQPEGHQSMPGGVREPGYIKQDTGRTTKATRA